MINRKPSKKDFDKNQNGAALVVAIFSILLVTVIGFALVATGLVSLDISKNARQQTEANYISEAGVNHAIQLITAVSPSQYSSILQAGDGVANTGDELSTQPAASTPIPATGITIGNGYYVVYVSNDAADADPKVDTNQILVVRSVGYGQDGSTATTEAIVSNQNVVRSGILADGDMKVSNNLNVLGPDGRIMANGTFTTNNPVCVQQKISQATSTAINLSKITSGSTCATPGAVGTNVFYSQPVEVPEIHDVPNLRNVFRSQANWIFKSDGSIYRQGAALAMSAAEKTADGLSAWTCSSCGTANHALWTYSSSTRIENGTYYMESSDIMITNGGNSASPPQVTFVAEGSIQINNNPSFQPKLSGYALIAGNDVSLSSTIGVSGNPGMVYAYGQLEINNTSNILGWLQAANYRHADGTHGSDINNFENQNLVQLSSKGTLTISGQTTVTTPTGWGSGAGFTVISRREVRY